MKSEQEFLDYYSEKVKIKFSTPTKPKGEVNALPVIIIVFIFFAIVAFLVFGVAVIPFIFVMVWLSVAFRRVISEAFRVETTGDSPDLKAKIIPEILNFYAPELTYSPDQGMMDKTIEISNIFDGLIYRTADYTEGKVGNTFVQMCSLNVIESEKDQIVVFSGIYMLAPFNKNFKGQYTIFSGGHFAPSVFVPGKEGPVKLDSIKLENPEFNNKFSAYGTDHELEARYILTPAMMEKMLDVVKENGDKIHFGFARNHIFFAISTGVTPFEQVFSSSKDVNVLRWWNHIIHFSLSMVEQFNLDEHLWSKP